ncbi:MAG: hypothetical protein R3B49_07900 [Phycisphaerales bacterium]
MTPDRERPPEILVVLIAALAAALASPALAQTTENTPDPIPSLDDLLGITDSSDAPADRSGALDELDPARAELEQRLESGQLAEAMQRAAALMDQTARRLADAQDPGVVTQRLQQDTLLLLDQVIAAAQQNNQNQSNSSSPSSSQSQQDQQQPNQPRQQQQQQQQQPGEPGDTHMPGQASDVQLRPGEAGAGAAWGALPERLRSALMQGLSDRYSSIYEHATESYYRRLAEEESP